MMAALRARLQDLLAGFWLIPGAVALAYIGLAVALTTAEAQGGPNGFGAGFGGDASAARQILSVIAGSLTTVAGLTFSVTIVALQLVSSQFTPRALRGFLADRVNQVVAGSFVGVVSYCLLVLRVVRDRTPGPGFVPSLSVTIAIAFGVIALGMLILFIHHMGQSIQLSQIAERIGRATLEGVERLYPERFGDGAGESAGELPARWSERGPPGVVDAGRPGWIRSVSLDGLVDELDAEGLNLLVCVCAGDFVTPATPLVEIWPREAADDVGRRAVRRAIAIAGERDLAQDVDFGLRQLADIVLRAISPAVNDPTTAITCIGYLEAALESLAGRARPAEVRRFPERDAIVVVRRRSFAEHVQEGFRELAWSAAGDARVAGAAVAALGRVARVAAGAPERVAALAEAAAAVLGPALEGARTERDRVELRAAGGWLSPGVFGSAGSERSDGC